MTNPSPVSAIIIYYSLLNHKLYKHQLLTIVVLVMVVQQRPFVSVARKIFIDWQKHWQNDKDSDNVV